MGEMNSRVYFVKDLDLGLVKIGHKKDGNSRMETQESFLKNKYPTNLKCIRLSPCLARSKAIELEQRLHAICSTHRCQYPSVTLSVEHNGKTYSAECNANGYTEWFDLPDEVEALVLRLIENA